MKFWKMLIVGLFLSLPAAATAGSGNYLACLKNCDPTFKATWNGAGFTYSVNNTCTQCCDNTFKQSYTDVFGQPPSYEFNGYMDCQKLYSKCKEGCYFINKAYGQTENCTTKCTPHKDKCLNANAIELDFSCTN